MLDLLSPFHFEDEPSSVPGDAPVLSLPDVVLLPGEPLSVKVPAGTAAAAAENALTEDRFLAVACAKKGAAVGTPENRQIATIGRIVAEDTDLDGQLHLVLLGLKRVRIGRLEQESPYHRFSLEAVDDRFSQTSSDLLSGMEKEILSRLNRVLELRPLPLEGPFALPMDQFAPGALPLGMLCDMAASAAGLGAQEKRMILEEMDVVKRAEKVVFCLQFLLDSLKTERGGGTTLH
jgi:Lon protease-like protein